VFQRVEVHFLFGARDNGEELLFADFLTQFFEGNKKNKLYLACSREVEDNKIKSLENVSIYKGYIQNMIKDESCDAGRQL
jgi:sulfite reductase alpha subunit-like flavoprotein